MNAACTNLSAEGTRRHIRGALEAGATREEILMILKIASLLSIHTCSLGAPILLEEAKAAGVKPTPKAPAATPVCDKMKAAGQWNTAWDGFFEIDPAWTEAIIAASLPVYTSGVFSPKLAELLSIAVDASITHMYAPGTRRHIQSALKLGATMEEIMEVLKICVAQGMQASNLGVPILAEELQRAQQTNKQRNSSRSSHQRPLSSDSTKLILFGLVASALLNLFSIGLKASLQDATYLFRRPGELVRALLAMNVLMPLFARHAHFHI